MERFFKFFLIQFSLMLTLAVIPYPDAKECLRFYVFSFCMSTSPIQVKVVSGTIGLTLQAVFCNRNKHEADSYSTSASLNFAWDERGFPHVKYPP